MWWSEKRSIVYALKVRAHRVVHTSKIARERKRIVNDASIFTVLVRANYTGPEFSLKTGYSHRLSKSLCTELHFSSGKVHERFCSHFSS